MTPRNRTALLGLLTAASAAALVVIGQGRNDVTADVDLSTVWPDDATLAVLVDLADDLSDRERRDVLAELPDTLVLNSDWSAREGLYRAELAASEAAALVERFGDDPRIEFIEPDHEVESYGAPNDPMYAFQWNFEQVDAEGAWKQSAGQGVVVAVIDTGVTVADRPGGPDRQLRDLAGTEFVDGWDFVDDDDKPWDGHGHGTHVAGTVAQTTDNGYGVAGLAPRATIMPLRVLDDSGRGNVGDIADSIRFAADNGADIINMSLGGPLPSRVMMDAVRYAHRRGVTIIAAAGNSGWSMPSFPAAYRHVIGVSATQYDRTTTFYSNYGSYIDIAAPGGNTRVDQNDDGRPDGVMQETIARGDRSRHEFALYMGTSMASPHVAAGAALVHAMGVDHPERIEEALLSTASQDVPEFSSERYGAGLMDVAGATRFAVERWQLPRAAFASLLALFAVALAGRGAGARSVHRGGVAAVSAVTATGLAVVVAAAGWFGVTASCLGPWATSPLYWPATVAGIDIAHSVLVMSVVPALTLVGVFGAVRGRLASTLLVGVLAGLGALLMSEALVPLVDVEGIPGIGILDRAWLALNAGLALVLAFVSARRAR